MVISEAAYAETGRIEGPGVTTNQESDQGDAWRHCLWQCEVAKRWGANVAEAVGDIHEETGLAEAAAQPQVKNRFGRTPKEQEAIRTDMDQLNNQIGRNCAQAKSCKECCLHQLSIGRLITTLEGDLGTTGPGHTCEPRVKKRPITSDPLGRPSGLGSGVQPWYALTRGTVVLRRPAPGSGVT
jgi:hypothetical protein